MIRIELTDAQGRLLQEALEAWQSKFAKRLLDEVWDQVRNASYDFDYDSDEERKEEAEKNFDFFVKEEWDILQPEEVKDIERLATEEEDETQYEVE